MKLNPKCMTCQLRKQEAKIRHFDDEDRKKQYMEKIRRRFDQPKEEDCVPSISTELKKFYCSFWGVPMEDFSGINREYDQLMLDLEEDLLSAIRYSADPLFTPALATILILPRFRKSARKLHYLLLKVKTKMNWMNRNTGLSART
mgnify:FL=1